MDLDICWDGGGGICGDSLETFGDLQRLSGIRWRSVEIYRIYECGFGDMERGGILGRFFGYGCASIREKVNESRMRE